MCKKKAKDTKSDDEKTRDVVGPLSSENRIALMAVLRDEWKYRDQTFCLYFWRFIYLSLVVTFLPAFLKATGMEIRLPFHHTGRYCGTWTKFCRREEL